MCTWPQVRRGETHSPVALGAGAVAGPEGMRPGGSCLRMGACLRPGQQVGPSKGCQADGVLVFVVRWPRGTSSACCPCPGRPPPLPPPPCWKNQPQMFILMSVLRLCLLSCSPCTLSLYERRLPAGHNYLGPSWQLGLFSRVEFSLSPVFSVPASLTSWLLGTGYWQSDPADNCAGH